MRIATVGHSLINYKQYNLYETIGEKGLAECKAICPSSWYDETGIPLKKTGFELKPLFPTSKSWMHYWLVNLKREVLEFKPDILYIMQEPFSLFTLWCLKTFQKYPFKKVVFGWENKEPKTTNYDLSVWKQSLDLADLVVCGSKDTERWANQLTATKTMVCPQSGIDTELFKPIDMDMVVPMDMEKIEYDLVYVGRFAEEKGVKMIEQVAKELNLKVLWVGGRGKIVPEYGDKLGWVNYIDLPMQYNKAKLFVSFTYDFQGYAEQFNYCPGEAMACGIPAIISDNGSQKQAYENSPITVVKEKDIAVLKETIQGLLKADHKPELLRNWVVENLSNEAIGKRLVKAFEELR